MKKLLLFVPLLITVTILSIGSVRGWTAAKTQPEKFPCAFEKKSGSTWRGGLSLDDARALQRKAVRVGKRIPVRYVQVGRKKVRPMIACVARAYGMAPAPFFAVAECETHVTPDDNIFQYIPSTWDAESAIYGHKGADENDAYANIHVTVQWVHDGGWGPWACA